MYKRPMGHQIDRPERKLPQQTVIKTLKTEYGNVLQAARKVK